MPIHITIASVSMPAVREACRYAELHDNSGYDFKIYHIGNLQHDILEDLENDIVSADLLLTDLMGAEQHIYEKVVKAMKLCKGQRIAAGGMAPSLSRLGGYDAATFRINEEDEENLHRICECWKRAESEDIEYIFNLILKKYLNQEHLPDAHYPEIKKGVYIKDPNTNKEYDSPEGYYEEHFLKPESGRVVFIFSGNNYPTKSAAVVQMLFNKLAEFSNVLPIAMNSYDVRYIPLMEMLVGHPDVIVNVLPFRFMAGPMGGDSMSATDLLKRLDATYLSPFYLTKSTMDDWKISKEGLNPMEFMLNVFLPEIDGALCTLPVGANTETEYLDKQKLTVYEILPMEDRIDRIAGKVRNYIHLRNKKNSKKKIAILAYNYPPGEGNLFGGSFLDGAGSISSIIDMLYKEGYNVEPRKPKEIIDIFIKKGIFNEGQWISPSDEVILYDGKNLHPEQVEQQWGEAPGDIMVHNGKYLIPGITNGNVFIGVQPPRVSTKEDLSKGYHDQKVPPHHQYLAMYEWIRDVFKADAVIHLGTHGTAEFLPGKESAMSAECYPDMIMGDVVHIYAYYVGNPSEAMIAKRRSHACLISYMPPPFAKSGIYGDLIELEESIEEYRESVKTDSGRSRMIYELITLKAKEMRLPLDIDELEDEIIAIRNSLIPLGLHAIGNAYSREEAEFYATNAIKFPHENIETLGSIDLQDFDIERIFHEYNSYNKIPESLNENEEAKAFLEYGRILADASMHTDEMENIKNALEGRYVDVKPGGDIMKNPEILPSGYNITQFNPDRIPTAAAFERGKQAAERMIRKYNDETGSFPHSASLVLWGLETSRTQGMSIGQIMWYLGLKMVRNSGNFEDRFEVVPLSELGRPRIDVTITMCGFFRDMFPNLIPGLSRIFSKISSLDEPEELNFCKAGTKQNRNFLESKGYTGNRLDELSECRLFGPAEGEYGTSITNAVKESSWKDEKELGELFEKSLRHAYTQNFHGLSAEGLLNENHKRVEVISQIRDSTDREIIDLDHYYEFLGGLSKAVETARGGTKAHIYVVDGSGYNIGVQNMKSAIERGIRTRLLNPKWIDGLLDVKYHGTQKINDRFENMIGLAATTGKVESSVFSDMLKCYVEDECMRRRVRENNNWAYMAMLNRMFEANSRGYWNATEAELELLKKAYEESEEIAELETDLE